MEGYFVGLGKSDGGPLRSMRDDAMAKPLPPPQRLPPCRGRILVGFDDIASHLDPFFSCDGICNHVAADERAPAEVYGVTIIIAAEPQIRGANLPIFLEETDRHHRRTISITRPSSWV